MSTEEPPASQLSVEELRKNFGSPVDLEDQLAHIDDPTPGFAAEVASSPTPVLRVPGIVLLVLVFIGGAILLQTFVALRAPAATTTASPAPIADNANDEETIAEIPAFADEVRALVRSAKEDFSQGMYQEVIDLLGPLTDNMSSLDPDFDFQVSMFMATAYRELGDLEQSRRFTARLNNQFSDPDLQRNLQRAREILEDGRHAEARQRFYMLSCLADLNAEHTKSLPALKLMIAETFLAESRDRPEATALPGMTTDTWQDAGKEWQ